MITGTEDLKIFSKNPKKSIFVRDLPYSCTFRDLAEFFSETLQAPSEEAVQMAVERLNGCRFIGRDIRVLAYDPKAPTEPSTTGLVHVSFKTMSAQQPLVTEATLRASFDSFGEIDHVAIRTHKFTEMGLQGGYGFLTFHMPEQNRTVVEQVRQVVIDGILRAEPAASARPYGAAPGANPNAFYDPRRNVPSGYPQSAYGGSRGYPPVDYERERAMAMGRGGHPADYYPPARPDPYYDPRDPYAARYAAGRDPRDPYAAAAPAGRYPPRDPYDRRDIGYEQDLYDRRRGYPPMLPPDNGPGPLPGSYHRPGYPSEREPYDPRAPYYAVRRPEDDLRYGAPYPPSERDYLDPRRAPAGPAGAYSSGMPYDSAADRLRFDGLREASGSAAGYHGLELDELGLPVGRPAIGAGNPVAAGLGLKPPGPDAQREVDPLWKGFSGGSTGSRGYFATSADPRANFLYNGVGSSDMNSSIFGNRNATGSELDGSALPPQPPAAGSPKRESLLATVGGSPVFDKKSVSSDPDSSFRMDSLVDALWSPALPAGNVPLEALEGEIPLSYGEKPADSSPESAVNTGGLGSADLLGSAESQESVVTDAPEVSDSVVMPPGLAKADLSTSTTLVAAASRKQSTDDDLSALIGE
eukprot:gene7521-5407_t